MANFPSRTKKTKMDQFPDIIVKPILGMLNDPTILGTQASRQVSFEAGFREGKRMELPKL